MPSSVVLNGDCTVPVRMMVKDGSTEITSTTATDVKLSAVMAGVGLAGAAAVGTQGTVTKVAVIPVAAGAPTKAEYDAMRLALINAGLMASS